MNIYESTLLKKFIENPYAYDLSDVKLVSGYSVLMLYPTDDLWLTEKQFELLKVFLKKIDENEFFFTQYSGSSFQKGSKDQGIFSEANPVYKFNLDSNYAEYYNDNIFLFSVSGLFSSKGTWAIFIDETFEAGYGIFVASEDMVNEFRTLWETIRKDYPDWLDDKRYEEDVEFYQKLLTDNGVIK